MSSSLVPELVADTLEQQAAGGTGGRDARCRNCEAPLVGPYCAQCGQRAIQGNPTLRELAGELWESVTNLDGKVALTVRDLLRHPGRLTREYLAGRRARYLPPVRLYLLASVAFFLVSAYEEQVRPDGVRGGIVWREEADSARADSARARDGDSRVARTGRDPATRVDAADDWWSRRKGRLAERMRARENRARLGETFERNLPKLMFVLVPAFALLLGIAYRGRRWNLPAHVVVALHMHAFFFVVLLAGDVDSLLFGQALSPWSDLVATAWLALYGVAMLRGAYGGRWRTTVLRAAFVSTLYGATIVAGMLALVFALALLL